MNLDLALILTANGLASGAVYLLAGLGLVLVFSVTRVVFVPFGDIAAFSALSLAAIESGRLPPTIPLVALLALLATTVEIASALRHGKPGRVVSIFMRWFLVPLIPCAIAWSAMELGAPHLLQVIASAMLVVPLAPLLARLFLQPIADSSTLTLLIVALAIHFILSGLGLLFFGPDGVRTQPFIHGRIHVTSLFTMSAQTLVIIGFAFVSCLFLYALFERTGTGKALRATAVNRIGARLVGIRPASTALQSYILASFLAGLVGVLIAPVNTVYYDSGFIIGLKAFVAAIIGGLTSFPLTAIGALSVGLVESFASYWSGALKDVLVFSLLIPILLVRSWLALPSEDDMEEMDS
ncbi:MAG: branched-chain amino acid ABC transporter permease [Acidobacteriota bacterium]|nr:branched-chain amino acid ABC transporter permease [Acidobacteriota bacterium]